MRNTKIKLRGSVSLTTVILVSAVLLLSGIIVVLNSVDLSKASKGKLMNSVSTIQSYTCFEEVLERLKMNRNYTGTFTISLPNGTCDVAVSIHPTQNNYRNVLINSNANGFFYTENRIVDISVSPIQIID
jgi:hypothetical protein